MLGALSDPVSLNRYLYCGSAAHIEESTYDRELALRYAYAFSQNGTGDGDVEYLLSLVFPGYRNPLYPTFGGNCANFVSQVLHEGGFSMTEDWHTRPNIALALNIFGPMKYLLSGKTFDTTPSWSVASAQFEFLSDPSNGFTSKQVIDVHRGSSSSGKGGVSVAYSDLASRLSSLDVRPGDVMYFYNKEEGVHHATVISKVAEGEIYYAGNTVNRYDWRLSDGIGSDAGVLIVRINDEAA